MKAVSLTAPPDTIIEWLKGVAEGTFTAQRLTLTPQEAGVLYEYITLLEREAMRITQEFSNARRQS